MAEGEGRVPVPVLPLSDLIPAGGADGGGAQVSLSVYACLQMLVCILVKVFIL